MFIIVGSKIISFTFTIAGFKTDSKIGYVVVLVLVGIFVFTHIVCVRVLDAIVVVFIKAVLHNDVVLPLVVLAILFPFIAV